MNQQLLQIRENDLYGSRQSEALEELDASFENIRAAWNQAVVRRNIAAVDAMIDGLYAFTEMRGRWSDGSELFAFARRELLSQDVETSASVSARLLSRYPGNANEDAMNNLEMALSMAEEADNKREVAHCLHQIGREKGWKNDFENAISYYEKSLSIYRNLEDKTNTTKALLYLSVSSLNLGDLGSFQTYVQEALTIAQSTGHLAHQGWALGMMGEVALLSGDLISAEQLGRQSYDLYNHIGARFQAARSVMVFTFPAIWRQSEDLQDVLKLMAEAEKILTAYQDNEGLAIIKILNAYIAGFNADYGTAKQLGEAAEALASDSAFQWMVGRGIIGYAELGLGNYRRALQIIIPSLKRALELGLTALVQRYIIFLAYRDFYVNSSAHTAAEYYGLAFHNGDSAAQAQEGLPLNVKLKHDLIEALGEDTFLEKSTWEQGQMANLHAVAMATLHQHGELDE